MTFLFVQPAAAQDASPDILSYIDRAWSTLTRSMSDCRTVMDARTGKKAIVYFPADAPLPPAAAELQQKCGVEVARLPQPITRPGQLDPLTLKDQGLLYLPHPYVVPGGFFNEMYGWDSYFILRGLLESGRTDLARGIVENFEYEIQHYGAVLNANRTYFLTRSQPPFLSSMVLAVYDADPNRNRDFLEQSIPFIVRDYEMWTSPPHLAGSTGLSRYYDFGSGPSPDLSLTGDTYYADVISGILSRGLQTDYFASAGHPGVQPNYSVAVCVGGSRACAKPANVTFTDDYYRGDRAMRESGFDVSFRFGPYSGRTHHFAPVCLNSLLYKTEKDLERIHRILGRPREAGPWAARAARRAALMNRYFWDSRAGLFFDWDVERNRRSDYRYLSTFYPLWTGMASPAQAAAVARNLKIFEKPGGLATSDRETGVQWDLPYGWAPLQLIAVEGLRRYGYDADAARLSRKFLSMVNDNFRRDRTIREKYNVVTRSDEVRVEAGYAENVIGFGWTNGVFLALLHALPPAQRREFELPTSAQPAAPPR